MGLIMNMEQMEKDMEHLGEVLSRLKETMRQQLLRDLKRAEEAVYQAEYDDFSYTNGTMASAKQMVADFKKKLEELDK